MCEAFVGMGSNDAEGLLRNNATFHERFRASVSVHCGSHTIALEQTDGEQSEGECMQGTVWDAGVALAYAMPQLLVGDQHGWHGAIVIELGSGTGLCGIHAALLGASQVTLTDLPPLLPLLRRNAAANSVSETTRVCALDWGQPTAADHLLGTAADVILGSDITCFLQDLDALAATVAHLSSTHTKVYLAHHDRGGDGAHVLNAFASRFDSDDPIQLAHPSGASAVVHLYRFRKRQGQDRSSDAVSSDDIPADIVASACRGDLTRLKCRLASV